MSVQNLLMTSNMLVQTSKFKRDAAMTFLCETMRTESAHTMHKKTHPARTNRDIWNDGLHLSIQNGGPFKERRQQFPKGMCSRMPRRFHKEHLAMVLSKQWVKGPMYWPSLRVLASLHDSLLWVEMSSRAATIRFSFLLWKTALESCGIFAIFALFIYK